ncbi:hypothetical protein NIES4073_75980 [Kalymmatonema gypsitolerans NIES-4073]|nr:hypothetical protein NIES4073_75980 [Scytonema sp. NIES-4073]
MHTGRLLPSLLAAEPLKPHFQVEPGNEISQEFWLKLTRMSMLCPYLVVFRGWNTELRPLNTELRPQNTKLQPQNSKLHPQKLELQPQNSKLHPQNTKLHPQELKLHPQNTKLHPQKLELQLQNSKLQTLYHVRLNNRAEVRSKDFSPHPIKQGL